MAAENRRYLTRNVFVAGRTPEITYNPRDDRHLETEVMGYLGQLGKALSVSGPTKSGKTVLIERLMPKDEAIWFQGSDLTSVDALWLRVIDWFNLYDVVEIAETEERGTQGELSGQAGIAGLASVTMTGGARGGTSTTQVWGRNRAHADVAREAFETLEVPIVIDDFHYVPDPVKRDIARALKSSLPLTQVVLIAVPHQAFEVVRDEPDMGARVWQLRVEHWTEKELVHI